MNKKNENNRQNNGETQKPIRQKYVHKQAKMQSQRNVTYSRNKK